MIRVDIDIALVHTHSHEQRIVPVLEAEKNQKLCIRWGLAGVYVYDIQKKGLLKGRRILPWVAVDEQLVFKIWHQLIYPGKHLPDDQLPKSKPSVIHKGEISHVETNQCTGARRCDHYPSPYCALECIGENRR